MSKITLTNLVNLQNETTAVNAINNNNVVLTTALDNTLSRNGTTPNTMSANLDMNSNHILNLPTPISNYEPLRVIDKATLAGGGITVSPLPVGGTVNQVLGKNSSTNFDVSWKTVAAVNTGTVLDYGVSNVGADCTTTLQTAINAVNVVIIPPGTYNLSGGINIPSNRYIWVQKGATITNTGGRFTAAAAGINNIHLRIDGVMSFVATATAPALLDWPNVPTNVQRGLIEMGGTHVSPGKNLRVTGTGTVFSDFVWPGTPPSGFTNQTFQLNRKGIAFWNSAECMCDGLEIYGIYGEAVYLNGYENTHTVRFTNNFVHDVAFDALNFNIGLSYSGLVMSHNRVKNALCGIEASAGDIHDNDIENTYNGMIFGGGGGVGPLRICANRVVTSINNAYDLEFSFLTPVANVSVIGNSATNTAKNAFVFDAFRNFNVIDNISYAHAASAAGAAFTVGVNCSNGYLNGNVTTAVGGFSTGNFVNNAGGAVTLGTNPVA